VKFKSSIIATFGFESAGQIDPIESYAFPLPIIQLSVPFEELKYIESEIVRSVAAMPVRWEINKALQV
jgi:hypothetical protein